MDHNDQSEPTLPPAEQVNFSVLFITAIVVAEANSSFFPDAPKAPGHAEQDSGFITLTDATTQQLGTLEFCCDAQGILSNSER
jgi:hypothetical protein